MYCKCPVNDLLHLLVGKHFMTDHQLAGDAEGVSPEEDDAKGGDPEGVDRGNMAGSTLTALSR